MVRNSLQPQNSSGTRDAAYTTPRQDIFDLVPHAAQYVLDVGCSNGALGRSLISGRPDRHVSGIEFDADFSKEAERHLNLVVNADLNSLDWNTAFGANCFDCIIFADVLEHLIHPERCLLQAHQHLRPGGSIVISLPNIRHLSALRAIFLSGSFPQRDRGIFDRTHMRWFTIADAHSMINKCGFEVTSTSVALRWGDTGGGFFNRLINRLPQNVKNWLLVREFLTYQFCIKAEVAP